MAIVTLTGPFPTIDETADRLKLTREERISVNQIIRERAGRGLPCIF